MHGIERGLEWVEARPRSALAAVFGLALAIRLGALALAYPTLPAGDEAEMLVRAVRAVVGPPIEDDAGRAPGLLLFYATAFRAFGVGALTAKIANVFVSALTVVPVFAIGRAFGGLRVGLLAALGVAVYPTYVAFSHFLWPAPLYILLITSGLALLLPLDRVRGRGA